MTLVCIKHNSATHLLASYILNGEDSHRLVCNTSFTVALDLIDLGAGQLGGDSLMALRIVFHTNSHSVFWQT